MCPDMEHRRMGETRPDRGGEYCRKCSGKIRCLGETELGQQFSQQGQGEFGLCLRRGFGHGKFPRVKYPKHTGGGIIARRLHQAAVRAEIRLTRQSVQYREMGIVRRIEQHRGMPRRRISAHPVLTAGIESFPCSNSRHRSNQGRLAGYPAHGLPGYRGQSRR